MRKIDNCGYNKSMTLQFQNDEYLSITISYSFINLSDLDRNTSCLIMFKLRISNLVFYVHNKKRKEQTFL